MVSLKKFTASLFTGPKLGRSDGSKTQTKTSAVVSRHAAPAKSTVPEWISAYPEKLENDYRRMQRTLNNPPDRSTATLAALQLVYHDHLTGRAHFGSNIHDNDKYYIHPNDGDKAIQTCLSLIAKGGEPVDIARRILLHTLRQNQSDKTRNNSSELAALILLSLNVREGYTYFGDSSDRDVLSNHMFAEGNFPLAKEICLEALARTPREWKAYNLMRYFLQRQQGVEDLRVRTKQKPSRTYGSLDGVLIDGDGPRLARDELMGKPV